MPDRTKAAQEWFEKGRHDIEGARLLFEREHFTDTIAMLIQQALEKYLKGYLILHGWKLKKIHDLIPLLAEATTHNSTFQTFEEDCRRISEYYSHARYPGRMPIDYPREEIRKSLAAADELIKLLEILKKRN
ncbi:MAG: HEPN domain-containing protein [Nitrospirae bacterium]|nr:HEPN domain-containing protein [Nitrospirota bacterium]MBI4838031.1 HEPN domain-containing protein [Nitrospirota bacterium]